MSWFDDALEAAMKSPPPVHERRVWRIVSPKRYMEAEKAQDAGATPRQIELCLAGMSWDDAKKEPRS